MAPRKPARASGSRPHLLVGPDSYLRSRRRQEIIADHVPEEAREFAVARFSLERTPLAEVLAQAVTRPMLSPRQVLVVTEVEELGERELAELAEYLASPADFTVLIFEAGQLDRRTRAARFLFDHCEAFEAESADDTRNLQAALEFARELEVVLEPETAVELVFVLGNDQGLLRTELEKLRAFVGPGGRVTLAAVATLVAPARKFKIFDLGDLLAERRCPEALVLLERLLAAGENPIHMVGALAWLYRQLLIARELPADASEGKLRQSIRAPRDKIPVLLKQARRFSTEELREAFGALLKADVALKSSPPNPAAVLEALVVRLAGGAPARAKA